MSVAGDQKVKLVVEAVLPGGTICQNVWFFNTQFAGLQADQDVLDALETWVEAVYANVMADTDNAVTYNDIVVDVVDFISGKWEVIYHVGTEDIDLTPTNAQDHLPNQVAPFCTFNTLRPKSKGRKFLYGYTEDVTSGSTIGSVPLGRLVDFATDAMADAVIDGSNYLVPGILRKGFDVYYEFASASVTNIVGTQRRRRPGVGI